MINAMMESISAFVNKLDNTLSLVSACAVMLVSWFVFNYMRKIEDTHPISPPAPKKVSVSKKEVIISEKEALSEFDEDALKLQHDLDDDDIVEIKKAVSLDMADPKSVKHYVQRLRTKEYKYKFSETEKDKEEKVKQEQLTQIYALMNQEKDTFGETSLDSVREQMSLYTQR